MDIKILQNLNDDQQKFVARLMDVGTRKYHDKHPFHRRMNEGKLNRDQLICWAVNRFYYQQNIPKKDALILANMPDSSLRRVWIKRIIDHDGTDEKNGGIEAWIGLVESLGGTRAMALDPKNVLPGVRFAVDAYVNFCRLSPWTEAVASSLTELFAPTLHAVRIEAFPQYYPWIDQEGLRYFRTRLKQAREDVEHGLAIVIEHFQTPQQQDRAVACLEFKCDLLWSQLDAIALACG